MSNAKGFTHKEKAADQFSDLNEGRDKVRIDTRPERIQFMTADELVIVQSMLGYGTSFGIWKTPKEWMSAGMRMDSYTQIDFRSRLTYAGVPEVHLETAVLHLMRYSVLNAVVPTGMKKANGRYIKPISLAEILKQCLPHLFAKAAKRMSVDTNPRYFGTFSKDDLLKMPDGKAKKKLLNELNRVRMLCDRGLWSDRPSIGEEQLDQDYTPGVAGDDPRPQAETKNNKHQPLPDEYVGVCSRRVLWIVNELGPSLLTIAQQMAEVTKNNPYADSDLSYITINERRRREFNCLLAEHCWKDRQGKVILEPPFPLTLKGYNSPLQVGQWPPRSGSHILSLLRLLQMAHLWIIMLSVGSRIGEMLSVRPGSIVHSANGIPFANGLTFKLVDVVGGEERDWPLPDVALEALRQQEKLCAVINKIGRWQSELGDDKLSDDVAHDSIWSRVGNRGEFSTTDVNEFLRNLVDSLGLTEKPGGLNLTTHRFRKTVARLVALALVGAPKILMDLFGHKTIEMTLYYILTDPDLQAEIRQVVEEVTIMRAKTAIEDIEHYGGLAAKKISDMVNRERVRLGKDLGAEDIRELAEILTMNGQAWEMPRPGVICTKLPGSTGPCNKKIGHPEPSRCTPICNHRLEEAYLRKDVDGSIAESVKHYEAERCAQNELMQEFWAGQILTHLKRFDDLCKKWSNHPTVVEIMGLQEQSA